MHFTAIGACYLQQSYAFKGLEQRRSFLCHAPKIRPDSVFPFLSLYLSLSLNFRLFIIGRLHPLFLFSEDSNLFKRLQNNHESPSRTAVLPLFPLPRILTTKRFGKPDHILAQHQSRGLITFMV